jgi:hypothetical protein
MLNANLKVLSVEYGSAPLLEAKIKAYAVTGISLFVFAALGEVRP